MNMVLTAAWHIGLNDEISCIRAMAALKVTLDRIFKR
jgi:hypothetical protein